MMLRRLNVFASCGLAVALCAPAAGQDLGGFYSGMAFNGFTSNQLNITQKAVGRNLDRQVSGRMELTAPGAAARTDANAPGLSFKASAAARRRNYAQFVAKTRAVDPQGASGLAETLKSDPVGTLMAPQLAQYGLRIDNVADAYAVYWIEAWEAAHGVSSASSRETANNVKMQAAGAILATPEFASASDAQKQELADAMLVQALLIGAAREQNKNDPAMLRRISGAVRQGASATGIDLDAMTLTEGGFVPADRTGAAAVPGQTPRADDAGSSHALLAVAGGVGLGAAFLLGKAMARKG